MQAGLIPEADLNRVLVTYVEALQEAERGRRVEAYHRLRDEARRACSEAPHAADALRRVWERAISGFVQACSLPGAVAAAGSAYHA